MSNDGQPCPLCHSPEWKCHPCVAAKIGMAKDTAGEYPHPMPVTPKEIEDAMLRPSMLGKGLDREAKSLGVVVDQARALLEASGRHVGAEKLVQILQIRYGQAKLAEEIGEINGVLKKNLDHGQPVDVEALTSELGDALFFLLFLARTCGISFESIIEAQLRNSWRRFGAEWSADKASPSSR